MTDSMLQLKTDPKLLALMASGASHTPTTEQIIEQRVSFVFGLMGNKSTVTRERVKELILEQERGLLQDHGK